MSVKENTHSNEPVAIVGSGCRFPGGASSPSKLWDLLKNPKDLVKKIPEDRFNVDAFYHPDGSAHGRTNARYGYFLEEDPYAFDPSFFSIPPTEAETVDPQQRLLLETVFDGITAAGLRTEDLRGSSTAVYVGLMQRDFLDSQNYDLDALNTYAATGTAASILANRVSYVFDWHGPSMTIDTACSSSLVAVHHAVEQLRTGLSEVAVAAGSNLMLGPVPFISASKLNMFSPNGRSRMWDIAADGYARGEGVGAIVMKTLRQAIADGDTVQCIIRESGINQDGKTAGITMPNSSAQEALIRQVYERAGLDVNKPEDRCQYFEAHGTGTPAGDPQEAQAIFQAFFGERQRLADEEPLYVGSIKTIIGHTEGTAGIAGLMKAAHLVQHGSLVPNMLLNELSPRVKPFCQDLQVVTTQQSWPVLKYGQPRRVSVNSFGFGGTNAQYVQPKFRLSPCEDMTDDVCSVIVEAYKGVSKKRTRQLEASRAFLAPIALSANSQASLRATIEELKQYLQKTPNLQMRDLAWTLLKKRSNLQFRHTLQARTIPDLVEALQRDVHLVQGKESIATSSDVRMKPQVLGVFTGQGAQWPAMGKSLVTEVPYAKSVIAELDESLQDLPYQYRPTWRLLDQLELEGAESNVHDARYSQPLCAAVQIILVKLLQAAGVSFKVVVGHSSGEIASAFAAGFISASQAIRIAYLRGLISQYASSPSGQEGAMMATGQSLDDATELCALEDFVGRLSVAASNAPESVTISGDKDAIFEAQVILEDEGKVAKVLRVDKAYHSHHMMPCAEPYVTALKASGCDRFHLDTIPNSVWISSVHEGKVMTTEDLRAEYWAENLVSPVLFSFALEQAFVKHTPLDIGVEVGAHPALKFPAAQVIQSCTPGAKVPYVGCMERSKDDTEAFSACLGYLWCQFGSAAVDIDRLYSTLSLDAADLSKELPAYSWDHSRIYRKESRTLRTWLAADQPHLLLGKQFAHSSPSSTQWQNFIRQSDIEWLDGHSLQGQTVFPGAGYAVMAMEAAVKLAGGREIKLFEVLDLRIDKAVTFEDDGSLVELSLTLTVDATKTSDEYAIYRFNINSCLARETGLSSSAAGLVAVTYGPGSLDTLPAPQVEPPHLNKVSIDRFYNMLDEIGYGYHKQFRGVNTLRRGDSRACGTIDYHRLADNHRDMVMHPATLDVAFQSFIGAYTAPGDRRLRSLLVPTRIERIALNPWVSDKIHAGSSKLNFISTSAAVIGSTVEGDIEVFDPETKATMLHVEGLGFKPFPAPLAADDHEMFCKWDWAPLYPETILDDPRYHATEQDTADVEVIERITYWYIKHFLDGVTLEDRDKGSFTFKKQISWCDHMLAEAKAGRNVWHKPEWEKDMRADIEIMIQRNIAHPFVRLIQRVGENAVETLRDNKNAFDLMDHDGLLTEFYGGTVSYGHSYSYYQTMLEQINHRHPNLDVLEIGAGTGGASRMFLNNNKLSFNSYTFTDISSAFFEKAAKEFEKHADKMDFRPLDCRRDPTEQEFKAHSYDVVIASNVLHATPNLEDTLRNARKLLKPGGRLIVVEVTHREHTRIGFIFGLFIDWWAGHDEGRVLEPFISYEQWDVVLKKAGFSGIDSRTLDPDSRVFPNGVFHTHAVNDLINRLDAPLVAPVKKSYAPLVVIGGSTPKTAGLVERLPSVLPARKMDKIPDIEAIIDFDFEPGSTFIVLADIDQPTLAKPNEETIDSLQTLFNAAHNVLWLTEDAWVTHPEQSKIIGLLRTLRMEYLDVEIQVVDVDKAENLDPDFLIETVLRLEDGAGWRDSGLLWTQEPELFLQAGNVIVPRLKPDVAKNNRLNAIRRPILHEMDPTKETLSFEYEGDEPFFKHLEERYLPTIVDESVSDVQVNYSLSKALRFGQLGYFYLLQGKVAGSNNPVVTVSQTNASSVRVPSSRLVEVNEEACVLPAVSAYIIAETMLSGLAPGSCIAIFDPPGFYVEPVIKKAAAVDINVVFISEEESTKVEHEHVSWVKLHAKETARRLRQKLRHNFNVFYDLTQNMHPASLNNRLYQVLPIGCSVRRLDDLFQNVARPLTTATAQKLYAILTAAVGGTRNYIRSYDVPVLTGPEIVTSKTSLGPNVVINWKSEQMIPSRVRSMETDQTFVDTRTYLLVGLTGDLGRSIARFMIEHGAKHIVLTSRSPKIDQRWIDEITAIGANVMMLSMDISKESSVDTGLAKVKTSMPAIGGVAFGPLVLQDVMFKNMDLETLNMVLGPKVEGVRLLDARLSDPANPLDFFVMFSSFVMVSGNPGQAAYSAANAYTHAIAQQRRARGMAGSTIDIGAVFGVGFIARAGREHEYDVVKFIFDEVNEWELHALFAEAVVAGRNKDIKDVEVITGMPYMDPINQDRIPYFHDPRFAFKLSHRKVKHDEQGGSQGSVKDRLLKASNIGLVRDIIIDGLSSRIRGALQLTTSDEINLTMPLIDQGVDSLSAVTVGSWFSKNLGIDVPLLKILGGVSLNDLVDEAIRMLPPETIPLAGAEVSNGASPDVVPSIQPSLYPSIVTSADYDDTQTSLSSSFSTEYVERKVPLSMAQELSWKQQRLDLAQETFNNTIGMYMQGPLNLDRLAWAFNQALQRNDAFRTAFISNQDEPDKPIQLILETPYARFEAIQVADKATADEGFKYLESCQYDLAKGDTLKIVDFHWTKTDHLLIIGYHRLVGDGWTTEHLFVEAGQLYAGAHLEAAPSYADFTIRQRQQLEGGDFEQDLEYWADLFKSLPARLPIFSVPDAKTNVTATRWTEHVVTARLNRMIAVRLKDRSRKHKVTPMHYYLASFHVLLARLTNSNDVAIGIADMNRPTLVDQATMGYFLNLLPVRMDFDADRTFNEALIITKEQMRLALLHSAVPYLAILQRLGLAEFSASDPCSHAPLFQAVLDYKQGQAESGNIGDAQIVDSRTSRAGCPYDITLEISDDPTKDPLITVKLQAERYGSKDAEVVMNAYLSILSIFSRNPALRVVEGTINDAQS